MRAQLLIVLLLAGGAAPAQAGDEAPRTAWGREEFALLPADTARLVVKAAALGPGTPQLGDEDLAALKRLDRLRILDLRAAGWFCQPDGSGGGSRWDLRLTDAGLEHLAALTSLEELYLTHAADITDEGIELLARSLPRLRHLSLPYLGRVGRGEALRLRALPAFPALASLDLQGSQGAAEEEWPGRVAAAARLEALDASWCRWLRGGKLAALAGMPGLRKLAFQGAEDGDLGPLAGFAGLRELDLSRSPGLTAAGLAPLAGVKGLAALDLDHCPLADGLSFLAGLATLERLDLADCRGLASLAPLAGLGALRSLRLDNLAGLADAELAHLSGLGSLEELSLCGCAGVTDDGLAHLLPLKGLRSLDLSGGLAQTPCRITDRGLAHLGRLRGLRRLNLSGVYWILLSCRPEADVFNVPRPFTDRGLRPLLALKELEELNLFYCPGITQGGAIAVAGLPRLRRLDLGLCLGLEEGTVRYIAQQHPGLTVLQPRRSSPGRHGDIW